VAEKTWDTATGLDYGPYPKMWPASSGRLAVKPHDFPPLAKNTKLVSEYDLEGRGDGFQIAKKGNYLYFCHFFSSGFSVVDVKDPKKPKVVKFIPSENPHAWNIKCRVFGDILIVAEEWKFFEPIKYTVFEEQIKKGIFVSVGENGPKEPIQAGIKIYDVSKPADPKLLSFYKVGGWSKEGGGVMCHRFSFDGHYAYLSAAMPGYRGKILLIVDLSNPREPREVSKWWMPGQWIAGGERPTWKGNTNDRMHLAIGMGDRCYAAWFGLGAVILDISDITMPMPIAQFNYDWGGMTHTFLPIKDRKFAVLVNEWKHTYMVDIRDEVHPKVVAMFPLASRDLMKRGTLRAHPEIGPAIHNIHENYPGPDSFRSNDIIFACCGPAGLRIYDVSDPYRVEEVGSYVPGTPAKQYDPRGPLYWGVDVEDIWVDNKGLIYLSDWNGGLRIVEFNG
jgi:hypothetical protein